jgi:SAM-dependent methyltransferase
MLTVDFDRLGVQPGERVLDMGCGAGRHAFELYRRGAHVTALDQDVKELADVQVMFGAMELEGEAPEGSSAVTVEGDALALPFEDNSFDRIIAAEILEHIPEDEQAIAELVRVLRPGGTIAVTVPRWLPERVCWALSDEYHANEGGHIRIYKASELARKLADAGLRGTGFDYAHALHAPFWWLKCAVGVNKNEHPLVKAYHRLLVWDIMKAPALTRRGEQLLNPVIGKSVILYAVKPE